MVRRGTIAGMLALIGCGLFVMSQHSALGAGAANWEFNIPFTGTVTIKDPKDAKVVINNLDAKYKGRVRVAAKGDSNLVEGAVISREAFDEAASASKVQPPTNQLVVDRFVYRDKIEEALKNYVRIDKAGDETSPFAAGQVVEKSEFDRVKREMSAAGKKGDELPAKAAKDPAQPEISTEFATLTLLPNVQYTLPLVIAALGLWLSWRLVNMPVFADFLIATEAELNKVSWTTRRRLMQDTVVVLVTVALLAAFILVVDTVWYEGLSWRVIGVLQVDKNAKKPANPNEQPW
jgi:preprotein translocase SecE subunit